jgi:mRNA-degrading endonuclease RelE of RelBE toxin-antitoxin system
MSEGWDYRFTPQARDDLRALDEETAKRVVEKLEDVVTSTFREPPEWLEPLEGLRYEKLRVGDYRALVVLVRDDRTLEVHQVGHRRNVYDRL